MGPVQNSKTRITLLGRLQRDPSDPQAWSEFVAHYGRKIYGWCRHWGLQDADAQDVTQYVLPQTGEIGLNQLPSLQGAVLARPAAPRREGDGVPG